MKKRTKIIGGVVGFFLVVGVIANLGDDSDVIKEDVVEVLDQVEKVEAVKPEEVVETVQEAPETKPVVKEEVKEEPKVEDTFSVSQKNAIRQAEQYINYTAFSKSGLVTQLEFEGYSNEEATIAVENIQVDWKKQAVLSAELYMDYSAFSRSGLIQQLSFEGHSQADAEYAASQVGL